MVTGSNWIKPALVLRSRPHIYPPHVAAARPVHIPFIRRLQDSAREERASASGAQEGLAAAPGLLQGTVATKAVRKSALGLSRRASSLESLAVEYLAAEVPYFLLRAPADVGPFKRGEVIVSAASTVACVGCCSILLTAASTHVVKAACVGCRDTLG